MSTEDQQATARIYRFPGKVREARDVTVRDEPATVTSLAELRQPAPPRPVIMIGAWYHDDAIREAPRAG
ncbi:MAG: DUF2735 domain-containing protein [Geminicoccaceae bacterium]